MNDIQYGREFLSVLKRTAAKDLGGYSNTIPQVIEMLIKKVENHMDNDLRRYLNKPYHIIVTFDNSDGEPGWVASVLELPGCITQADNWNELHDMIRDAMKSWILICLEDEQPIPEPLDDIKYRIQAVKR